jgi:hypothetical protein
MRRARRWFAALILNSNMSRKTKKTRLGVPIECRYDKIILADELSPHTKNYRKHPAAKVKRLRKTVAKNGWRRPIVVSKLSGCIVKGHGAWTGALHCEGGPDDVPVEYQDYADEASELADLVADNKSSEGSDDDDITLFGIIEELGGTQADPEVLGMSADEFADVLKSLNPDAPKRQPRKAKSLAHTIDFDDGPQKERFLTWLNLLKAEMEDVPTVGARLMAALDRIEGGAKQ